MASLKIATLFAALKYAGVTSVKIRYKGGGDSGQVGDINFDGDTIDESALSDMYEGDLQDLAYHILAYHCDYDWYDYVGEYGEVSINFEEEDTPTISINGYVRSVDNAGDSIDLKLTDINWGE